MAQQPSLGQGLLIVEASRSHSGTPQSIGLLWTSDQPDAETSTWQHTTLTKEGLPFPPAGFEPAIPSSERPFKRRIRIKKINNSYWYFIDILRKPREIIFCARKRWKYQNDYDETLWVLLYRWTLETWKIPTVTGILVVTDWKRILCAKRERELVYFFLS